MLDNRIVRNYILNFGFSKRSATLAQLVEHSIRNRKVIGSSPMGGSINLLIDTTIYGIK
jgi:hypothetical protein